MKTLPMIAGIALLLLSGCADLTQRGPVSAQSENSNRMRFDVVVHDQTMEVSVTNLTEKTVEVDGEMEIWFHYDFTGAGSDSKTSEELGGKPLSQRLVKLDPGKTLTKVFKSGDVYHSYSSEHGIAVDGKTPLWQHTMYTYRMPDFSKLKGVVVLYASGSDDSMIPGELAATENMPLPDDLLEAAAAVEVKLADDFQCTLPPYMLKGDKDLPHFGE